MQSYALINKNMQERKMLEKPVNTRLCRVIQSYAKYNKNTFRLPRQYLQKPNGGIYYEGYGVQIRNSRSI